MSAAAAPLFLASSAISAFGQIQAGRAQQEQYRQQAELEKLRGRSEAIAYKQKGAQILGNLNETLAAIVARAAAGNVDPTSGSARTIMTASLGDGITEANIAADNATSAIAQSGMQAGIYEQAGKTAVQTSYVQALGTISSGIYRYGQLA